MPIGHGISNEALAKRWMTSDWKGRTDILADYQRRLSQASIDRDWELVESIASEFLESFDMHMLAVYNISRNDSTKNPGVGESWDTDYKLLKGALILTHHCYESEPFFTYTLHDTRTKKDREAVIPSYYDRSIHDLFRMLMAPIIEPLLDLRCFSSREKRSIHDAVTEIRNIFSGPDAPKWVVRCDVRSFYDSISHSWVLDHFPMENNVLRQFLDPGRIYQGEGPIKHNDKGVPTGNRLSAIIGNFVLNGLESFIMDPNDPSNGAVVRWVDDLVISART